MPWSYLNRVIAAGLLGWLVLGTSVTAASDPDAVLLEPPNLEEGLEEGLEELVGPVALYPDDLLAIVLPASTYPLQIVQAARYLEALEDEPSLEPDGDWDESVVALLNYPEVLDKLNDDLDWTAALGEAVLNQEEDVLAAVNQFRREAYAAGNLASDRRQRVEVDDYAVRILRTDPAVIYVPYYESGLVRSRHADRIYHYYPRPCPVYYYPYPAGHYLASRHFWGMTSAFSIGWQSRHLSFHLLEHRSHPYYGHDYAFRHYRYWRPRLLDHAHYRHRDRYHAGNRWHPGRRWHPGLPSTDTRPPQTDRHEVPFTRPPASATLRQLERYQDDHDKWSRIYRARDGSAGAQNRGAAQNRSFAQNRSAARDSNAARAAARAEQRARASTSAAREASRAASRASARAESRMRYQASEARSGRRASASVRTRPAEAARSSAVRSSRRRRRHEAADVRASAARKSSVSGRGSYDPR